MALKTQIIGLNNVLSQLYRADTRLSTLLEHLGFNSIQIDTLRTEHLDILILSIIEFFCQRVTATNDGERRLYILNRRFGLDGSPPIDLESIGELWGVNGEQLQQLEEHTLRSCRRSGGLAELEDLLLLQASLLVGDPENEPPSLDHKRLRLSPFRTKTSLPAQSSRADEPTEKAYRVEDIRQTHPNAYAKWSSEADDTLQNLYKEGMTIPNLAIHFGRNSGAIRSRLRKLRLIE